MDKAIPLPLFLAAALFSTAALAEQQQQRAQSTTYGQYYGLIVSDPAAFVNALTTYRQSETGRKLSSSVSLSQNIANGADQTSHTVSVFYPSAQAMGADQELSAASQDWADFVSAISSVSSVQTENVFTVLRSRINDESVAGEGVVSMLFGLNATDTPRFMQALNALLDSEAAAQFPGNLSFGQIVAMGETPGTHWISFQARDMGTLMSGIEAFGNSEDFARYAESANEFREVVGRFMSRNILELGPAIN